MAQKPSLGNVVKGGVFQLFIYADNYYIKTTLTYQYAEENRPMIQILLNTAANDKRGRVK